MKTEQDCSSCCFYDCNRCKRHAPVIETGIFNSKWPVTGSDEWCGDWEPLPDRPEDRPISAIGFSRRIEHTCVLYGIRTAGELAALTKHEALRMRNFGQTSIMEARRKLTEIGIEGACV